MRGCRTKTWADCASIHINMEKMIIHGGAPLKGVVALSGSKIQFRHGYVEAHAERLTGGRIWLDSPSVGATQNIMMAAVTARGRTLIENAAREPEVQDLARVLVKMGAQISGAGSHVMEI